MSIRRWQSAAVAVALCTIVAPLSAQSPAGVEIVGRWDLRVADGRGGSYPSWLEVSKSGHSTLVGRYVGAVGSARPIARIDYRDGVMRFGIPPQWERDTADLRVEGRVTAEGMSGTLVTPGGQQHLWTATRAPSLHRASRPRWGRTIRLFDGRTLEGWTPSDAGRNRWSVANGILTNAGGGANLLTTSRFHDFKLVAEFRYPRGSNSGIYLRGRYEVQIEDPRERIELGVHDMGGIYGFLAPTENAARAPGEWQRYEITLVGRRLTVVLNGRTIVGDQIIPGITGGALDSEEGTPGPIYLQGDHGPIEFRRFDLTPAR